MQDPIMEYSFFRAVREGDARRAESLLDECPGMLATHDMHDRSALGLAVLCNWPDLVKLLLVRGAGPHEAVWPALYGVSAEILSHLVSAGIDVDAAYMPGTPLLHQVAEFDDYIPILPPILAARPDLDQRDAEGRTALHVAAANHNDGAANLLIEAGADVNARDGTGRTPLFDAATGGIPEIAEALLAAGADPNVQDLDGGTAISMLAGPRHIDSVGVTDDGKRVIRWIDLVHGRERIRDMLVPLIGPEILTIHDLAFLGNTGRLDAIMSDGPDLLETKDKDGFRALQYAVFHGHTDMVRMLLSRGADTGSTEEDDDAPIFLAARQGHLEAARLLVEYGADVCAVDDRYATPLHEAASRGHADLVRFLLKKGADPSAVDSDHSSPLHYAKEPDCIRYLILAGADVNARGFDGQPPLAGQTVEAALMLLSAGADPLAEDDNGDTPIDLAIRWGDDDLARLLVDRIGIGSVPIFALAAMGALDELRRRISFDSGLLHAVQDRRSGATLLHLAAEMGQVDVARYLLEQGIDPDVRDEDGTPPLHMAAESSSSGVAELLIACGADVNSRDNTGYTALHEAAYHCNVRVAELLIERGADVDARLDRGDTPLDQVECRAIARLLCRHGGASGPRRSE